MNFNYRLFAAGAATLAAAFILSAQSPVSISRQLADGRQVKATAITPYIIRVDNTAAGEAPAPEQSVLPLAPDEMCATVDKTGNYMITTGGVGARIFNDGSLALFSDASLGSMVVDRGYRTSGGQNAITLAVTDKGSFYGAGERGHKYNLRGDTLVMYNRQNYGYVEGDPRINQMNITMPLFVSTSGYAIVFDDYAAAKMILGDPIKYISESDKPITYYYIAGGENMADFTEAMTELTGRQPLPPLWSLGYITSKYGYKTQDETLAVVDSLKQGGYPLDGIVLDLYWYGKEEDMGRLAWDPEQWPDHRAMLSQLSDKGVNLVTISQPYVLRNGRAIDTYNELAPKGMFVRDSTGTGVQDVKIWVGEGGMFDVSNPDTRAWLTERYKSLTDMGVGGWWGDLGEPEVHPETGVHANGLKARLYHNKYGNDWSSIISELYASQYPDRRLMTLMRGGTIGLQRHSVFPWSTDVSRSWGGFQPQVKIMLNSGLSGLGYMSSDLGGFAVDPKNAYQPELYVRWVQCGLFSPVFRTHATQFAEPYHYPQYEHILKALVLERYRWLPYNYTLAYENARYGYPLVRPLDFLNNANGAYDNITDEYLWGSDVLVAPVMTEGAVARDIVLPEGSQWIDYYDPSRIYGGGTTLTDYPAPIEKLPLFVRRGAFIPTADYKMDNTGDYRPGEFTINWYPLAEGSSSYTLFDDNRLTPNTLSEHAYRLITFTGTTAEGKTTLTVKAEGTYEGAPVTVKLHFAVHGVAKAPKAVKVNGRKVKADTHEGNLRFDVDFDPSKPLNITF